MAMLYFSALRRGVSSEFDGFRCRRLVDSFLTHAQESLEKDIRMFGIGLSLIKE